jgi:uncharacterized protein YqhQ
MGACAILRATPWLKGHSLENYLGMNTFNYSSEILRTILLRGVGHIPSETLHLSEWTKLAEYSILVFVVLFTSLIFNCGIFILLPCCLIALLTFQQKRDSNP